MCSKAAPDTMIQAAIQTGLKRIWSQAIFTTTVRRPRPGRNRSSSRYLGGGQEVGVGHRSRR